MDPRELRPCYIALRPVRPASVEYYQLRESIVQNGILTPFLTRQNGEVVDGQTRHAISLELRLPSVPIHNRQMDDFEVLVCQLLVNPAVDKAAYVSRLWQIMRRQLGWDLNTLAHRLNQKPAYLAGLLGIDIDYEGMPAIMAAEISKVALEHREDLFSVISQEGLTGPDILSIIHSVARRNRQGKKDARTRRNLETKLNSGPQLRSPREILNELKEPTAAASVLHRCQATDARTGWDACLKWVWKVDPGTIEQRNDKLESQQRREGSQIRKIEIDLD